MPLPSKLPEDFGKNASGSGKGSSTLLASRYLVTKRIGAGNFGTAFLVKDEQEFKEKEKLKVLKQIAVGPVDPGETVDAMQEARLLAKLTHRNIVQFHESFLDGHNFCIIIEYCEGGDLECKLKDQKKTNQLIPEAQVIKWIKQLLKALEYMHRKRILHRDLKTRNIFLKDNEIKVGDFGISRILLGASDKASTFVGTPYYMSPEVLKHEQYDEKCDIWSLGCVLYEMCCLEHAFEGTTLMSVMMKIVSDHTPQLSQSYSRALNNVLCRMLDRSPENRQTAAAILKHALFEKSNGTIPHMTARDRLRIRKQREADENFQRLKEIARLQLKENHRIRRESQEKNFLKSSLDANLQVTNDRETKTDERTGFESSNLQTVEDVDEELQGTVTFKPINSTLNASLLHTVDQPENGEETIKNYDLDSTDELIQSLIRDGVIPEDAELADTFYSSHDRFESISTDDEEDVELPDEHLSYTQGEYRDLMEVMEGVLDLDDSTVSRGMPKSSTVALKHSTTSKPVNPEVSLVTKNANSEKGNDVAAINDAELNFTMFNANMMVQKIEKLREKCKEGIDGVLFDKAYKMMRQICFDDISAHTHNMKIIDEVKEILPGSKCMNLEELIYLEQQRDSNLVNQ